jgi:hypothetical protein
MSNWYDDYSRRWPTVQFLTDFILPPYRRVGEPPMFSILIHQQGMISRELTTSTPMHALLASFSDVKISKTQPVLLTPVACLIGVVGTSDTERRASRVSLTPVRH